VMASVGLVGIADNLLDNNRYKCVMDRSIASFAIAESQ